MATRPDMFSVVRRVVPAHGVKVGCNAEIIQNRLMREEADELADVLQAQNPEEEYAVVEWIFHRWTKPGSK